MRKILYLLTLVLVACGPDGKHIVLDGHLLNLNQGEFLVYSPDGALTSIDTIYVEGGRFSLESECQREGSLIVSMPNGQDIPVFVQPGNKYSIKGNAQNLREVEVSGDGDNALMNAFRKSQATEKSQSQTLEDVKKFVADHPTSTASLYLIRKYLLTGTAPDYATALSLLEKMKKADKENTPLDVLYSQVKELHNCRQGVRLPDFAITDVNGNIKNSNDMHKGTWIFCSTAAWDFDSVNQLRRIKGVKKDNSMDWNIVALSMDAGKTACMNVLNYDASEYIIVCKGALTENPLFKTLGIYQTAQVIVVKDGIVKIRDMHGEKLFEELKKWH